MSTTPQPIYSLLPAILRSRDVLEGSPLAAFYQVLEGQLALVHDNLLDLYDDQFIETCAPWVIPYIAQLIGYDPIYAAALTSPDSRAEVANTIGYRRRKGTLVAMEQLTHDVSGRSTTAVEEFRRLITTLSLRHPRKHHDATANLRRGADSEDQWGPFTRLNRIVDVRRIGPRNREAQSPDPTPLDIVLHGPGRFNIPDIAIWIWRWQNWTVTNAPAFSLAASGNANGYLFSSLGIQISLFQLPVAETKPFEWLITEPDVPEPIRRRRFCAQPGNFYPSSLALIADDVNVPLTQIMCANLEPSSGGTICTVPDNMIAIDPKLGRIQYAANLTLPTQLRVNYNYGSAAPIGGGPYDRSANLPPLSSGPSSFVTVIGPGNTYTKLEAAIAAWNEQPPGSNWTILLPNFESYVIDLTAPVSGGGNGILIPAQSQLLVAAAEVPASGTPVWNNSCVTLTGNIDVFAPVAPLDSDGVSLPAGHLQFSGLWIAGQLTLLGDAVCVQVADCTLLPGIALTPQGISTQPGQPSITGSATGASLVLNRTITGPIAQPSSCTARICNSIVDAGSPSSPAFLGINPTSPGASLHIEDSTLIGKVWAEVIRLASNTIFHSSLGIQDPWTAAVWARRIQTGCVRFCSLPWKSITPRRYECLPPDQPSEGLLAPQFVSLEFGDPAYCLLSGDCPQAVWTGADNGSQMGVYLQINETEAAANVRIRSSEYLPVTLERGVFLIPSRPRDMWASTFLHGIDPIPPYQFNPPPQAEQGTAPATPPMHEPAPALEEPAPVEPFPEGSSQAEPAGAAKPQQSSTATEQPDSKDWQVDHEG
jgi:hypothetical protein